MPPFSVIVFGVVVWTIAVSRANQLRFRLKMDQCGRGLKDIEKMYSVFLSSYSSLVCVLYMRAHVSASCCVIEGQF